MRHRLLLSVFALLCLVSPALAQELTGVRGTVKDAEGGVLPGVTVTVTNTGTNYTRTATTSGEGGFSIGQLPPGTYSVKASLQGFSEYELKDLRLVVGTTAPLSITLRPAGVEQTITVTGERTIIETTESDVSTAIPEELIENLPIAERNAITLALLTPGVSAAPYFDPTKSRDNFDGVKFGAGSASENLILVDGGDNNDDVVGSILQFYPQDSIQEFEVITSRFKAEYGHTDGGVVNMITKSGTNEFSGGAYYLVRDESLNSKTFVEEQNEQDKAEFHQDVVGALLGGPIVQDRAFFFGNIDYTKRDKPLLTDSGSANIPQIDEQGQVPQDFEQTLFVGKLTANLNASNFAMARYAYQDDSTLNVNLGGRDALEHGGLGTNRYHAFLVKNQSVIGSDKLNEAFYQFNRFKNEITSNAVGTDFERKEIIAGASSLGHNINHPQVTEQDKHQLVDNFSWHASLKGDHDFKVGFEYQRVETGGLFSTGLPFAEFVWNDASDFLAGRRADQAVVFNGPLFFVGESANDIFALYFQDDWKPTERLTLNLGLRWDVETNDWNQKNRTFISADPIFYGGQPETDKNNFGPRAGFAYDVEGDGKFVVRGGYGLYYQQIFWNSPIRAQFFEGELSDSLSFGEGEIDFGPDDPFCTPGSPQPGCIPVPVVPAPDAEAFVRSSGLTSVDPNLKTPYTHQFTAGFSTLLPGEIGFDVDYVHTRSDNQIYRTRIAGRSEINGLDTSNQGRRARVNTQGAELRYNGLLLSARRRVGDVTTQLSYTFGRAEGHIGRQTDGLIDDSDGGFDKNFGPLGAHRDHLFAGSVFWELPYEFQVGTILKFQSGYRFTGFDPTIATDLDSDGSRADNIAGDGNRGEFKGDSFSQVDVRFSKKFTLGGKYHPQVFFEVFNIFNAENEKPDSVQTNINEDDFGISTEVAGQPRQAQFSIRFDF